MSKVFAPRHFLLAGWTVAVVVVAAIAVAGVGRLRTHPASEPAKPVAGTPHGPALDAERRRRVRGSLDALPLAFEVNQGHTDPRIKYMARVHTISDGQRCGLCASRFIAAGDAGDP